MIKIRKLISSCVVGCSCLWLPVSAFACLTMEAVLAKTSPNLSIADLCLVGAREEAEIILRRENERATREIAALDVPPQHFAARRSAILDEAAWRAALPIQRLHSDMRIEFAALQRQRKREQREAQKKLLKEPRPPKDPKGPQGPQ